MIGPTNGGSLIRLDNVSKRFHSGLSCEIYPLNSVSLDVDQGERIILLGKSGSGKTTFLNLVGGVDVPTSGDIFFDGRRISAMSSRALALYRRKEVGFIFQAFNLFSTLSVGENLMLPFGVAWDFGGGTHRNSRPRWDSMDNGTNSPSSFPGVNSSGWPLPGP